MFWGLVLEPYKKYTQKVDQSFHISQAALDLNSCNQGDSISQLVIEYENSNFILATLSKKANIYQVPLDLIFKTGDQISFRVIGSGKVHLSGYHVLEDLDNMIMNGEEESDLEEIEIEEDKRKRKKSIPKSKGGKKAKVDTANEEESDEDFVHDDEDDSSLEDNEGDKKVIGEKTGGKKKKEDSFFGLDDDDDDEIDEAEEDEEEEEDDDEEDDEDDESDDDDFEDEEIEEDIDTNGVDSEEEKKTPKSGKKKNAQTPNGLPTSTKGNKGEQKLNQSMKDVIPGTPMKTPKNEMKSKNEKNFKSAERETTPKGKKNDLSKGGDKTPKSPKAEGSSQKKVLEGGVIAEELKIGNGPVAKPGKMANVYYVGTLSTTKKQFDAVQSGPGFKFRIGKNEVIKGWDIGLNGMKVGGKRRLTIPPHLAYGSKGSPPVIPPNSTLVFTVELKGLS